MHMFLLRRFGMGLGLGANVGPDKLALFSEGEIITGGACDMMEEG
jgi:hypothetical protein